MKDFDEIEVGDHIVMHDNKENVVNLIVEEIDDDEEYFWNDFAGVVRTIWAIDADGAEFEIVEKDEVNFLNIFDKIS